MERKPHGVESCNRGSRGRTSGHRRQRARQPSPAPSALRLRPSASPAGHTPWMQSNSVAKAGSPFPPGSCGPGPGGGQRSGKPGGSRGISCSSRGDRPHPPGKHFNSGSARLITPLPWPGAQMVRASSSYAQAAGSSSSRDTDKRQPTSLCVEGKPSLT